MMCRRLAGAAACVALAFGVAAQAGAGETAYIPPQTAHDILNTGTEPLVYVFCVAPAGVAGRP